MIQVAVPTRYNFSPSRGWIGRPDGLMWYAATQSAMIPPNSIANHGVYTNENALYEQIGAEFSYTGATGQNEENDFSLFPCRKACKDKVGKGAEFRNCLRECRGKGPKKSALRGMDSETDAELAEALKQASSDDSSSARTSGGSGNTIMWIVIAVLILGIIGFGIYLMKKKKVQP